MRGESKYERNETKTVSETTQYDREDETDFFGRLKVNRQTCGAVSKYETRNSPLKSMTGGVVWKGGVNGMAKIGVIWLRTTSKNRKSEFETSLSVSREKLLVRQDSPRPTQTPRSRALRSNL